MEGYGRREEVAFIAADAGLEMRKVRQMAVMGSCVWVIGRYRMTMSDEEASFGQRRKFRSSLAVGLTTCGGCPVTAVTAVVDCDLRSADHP